MKWYKYDDSFYGTLVYPEKSGLPFKVLIPFSKAEDDIIPRIFIMGSNPEHPYRSKKVKMYEIKNGKIKRIKDFNRDWYIVEEYQLQKFVTLNLKEIIEYFKNGNDFICQKV